MAKVLPPPTVPTHLNYYITPEKGGQKFWYPGTAGNFRRPQDVRPVQVTDVRQVDDKITLDVHGFQIVSHGTKLKKFDNDEELKGVYYGEIAEMLKTETGATYVFPISHFIRKMGWKEAIQKSENLEDQTPLPGGVSGAYCHVDQSYQGATELLSDNLTPDEVHRLTKSRWGIINVWRPINQTVRREPLAMCDARSVEESDLYPVRLHILPQGSYKNITDGKSFEAWAIAANEKHKWYYASELTPDECVLIKCYDSKLDGRARRCPHTAFNTHLDEGPPRESIEMRCLVFWEDQDRD